VMETDMSPVLALVLRVPLLPEERNALLSESSRDGGKQVIARRRIGTRTVAARRAVP